MFFFFFKQKTAYEMRISDWSSDVCYSDLNRTRVRGQEADNLHQLASYDAVGSLDQPAAVNRRYKIAGSDVRNGHSARMLISAAHQEVSLNDQVDDLALRDAADHGPDLTIRRWEVATGGKEGVSAVRTRERLL